MPDSGDRSPKASFDYAAARRFLEDKANRRAARCRELHAVASRDAAAIIDMIIENYQPSRIVQWGSIIKPGDFRENSDIDIAVEGIDSFERFSNLLGDAMAMTKFPLDIVQLNKIMPEFRDIILMKGKIVYERNRPNQSTPKRTCQVLGLPRKT